MKKPQWWILVVVAIVACSTRYFSIKHNDLFIIVTLLSIAVGLFFGYQGAATKHAWFAICGSLSLCSGIALADYFILPSTWPWAEDGYELLLIVIWAMSFGIAIGSTLVGYLFSRYSGFMPDPAPAPPTCRRCNYLLIGLASTRCPECGLEFPPVLASKVSVEKREP